jgi:hypothetical protein
MIEKTYFDYFETTQDGAPKEAARPIWLRDLPVTVSLRCPAMSKKKLAHLIDIAMYGGPVDLTHFEKGALVFSARIQLRKAPS